MTKLEQIQSSIEKLSAREIAELRDWLEELDARLFDEKIERDAKAGKLDKRADLAEACFRFLPDRVRLIGEWRRGAQGIQAGRGEEF